MGARTFVVVGGTGGPGLAVARPPLDPDDRHVRGERVPRADGRW
ncbi:MULTISPECIES: hypothetical protein [unclassified Micromonospora]